MNISQRFDLSGKAAVVTGGSQGIGFAIAELLSAFGAEVHIFDISSAGAAADSPFIYHALDLSDSSAVNEAVSTLPDNATLLVNNAGITRDASMKKMTSAQWQSVIDVNLTGVWNCTKAVAPYMLERAYGRIISAASVVGLYGNFGQANYVATKAGVIGLTKVWAREFGRKGVTANAIAPGFIATDMMLTIPEKVLKMMEEKAPVGRLGLPEEVANAYLFLASDEAAFINGATISVDGGLTL